jgi:hypothetical protein
MIKTSAVYLCGKPASFFSSSRCMAAPTGSSIKMPLLIHPTRAKKGRKKGREREREREASKQAAVSSRQFSEGRFGGNDAPLFATALNSIFDAHYSAASCSGTPARIGFPLYPLQFLPALYFLSFKGLSSLWGEFPFAHCSVAFSPTTCPSLILPNSSLQQQQQKRHHPTCEHTTATSGLSS